MKIRMISAPLLALVVALAALAPAPALGQSGRLYVATDVGVYAPATDSQLIRVTIGNPNRPDPAGDGYFRESSFTLELDGPAAPVTIGPGESFTYNLRRMGTERFFSVKFDLKMEVKTPDAPWGWKN